VSPSEHVNSLFCHPCSSVLSWVKTSSHPLHSPPDVRPQNSSSLRSSLFSRIRHRPHLNPATRPRSPVLESSADALETVPSTPGSAPKNAVGIRHEPRIISQPSLRIAARPNAHLVPVLHPGYFSLFFSTVPASGQPRFSPGASPSGAGNRWTWFIDSRLNSYPSSSGYNPDSAGISH